MRETWRNLSRGAKAGVIAGVAALAAVGVGLGVWQPWNQPEPPEDPAPVQQQAPAAPREPAAEELSVRANGEKVVCTLYEGDGWSVYVPEGWSAEELGGNGGLFSAGDGAQMSVQFLPGSGCGERFVNLSGNGGDRTLQFFDGTGAEKPSLLGNAPEHQWDRYGKLFTALARTLTVEGDKPFAESYIIPEEPDWQEAEGLTVLFLDKDGYIIDEKARGAVEEYMRSWPAEDREIYTGQYRINGIDWAGSYTGIAREGFIDVFRVRAQYRLAEGGEEKLLARDNGARVADGWASTLETLLLAVRHDGGIVERTQWLTAADAVDWADLAARMG